MGSSSGNSGPLVVQLLTAVCGEASDDNLSAARAAGDDLRAEPCRKCVRRIVNGFDRKQEVHLPLVCAPQLRADVVQLLR